MKTFERKPILYIYSASHNGFGSMCKIICMVVVFQFNCQLPKQNVYKRATRYFASYKIRTRRRSKYDCITILTFAIDKGKKRFQKCFGQEKINICTFV